MWLLNTKIRFTSDKRTLLVLIKALLKPRFETYHCCGDLFRQPHPPIKADIEGFEPYIQGRKFSGKKRGIVIDVIFYPNSVLFWTQIEYEPPK